MKPEMCVWQLLSQSIWLENGRKGDITQVLSEKVLDGVGGRAAVFPLHQWVNRKD